MKTKILFNLRHTIILFCVILCTVFCGRPSTAQNASFPTYPERGMIFENGAWRVPTAFEAKQMLMTLPNDDRLEQPSELQKVEYTLYAVIQQGLEPQPRIDLDAFVMDMIQIWITDTGWRRYAASSAVQAANIGKYHDGTPYIGVANELIRIYESIDEYPTLNANYVLYLLSMGEGIHYVRNIFNTTPKPPVCSRTSILPSDNPCPNISPWCDAGEVLIGQSGGPEEEEWKALCESDWISTIIE